jgi:hypothetical protein
MSENETANERYLVIEARWREPFPGRFVFALRDEESLHEQIAGISVVGIGFGSCERADAGIRNRSSKGPDSINDSEKLAADCQGDHGGVPSARQGLRRRVGVSETRRIAGATLQYAIAASVLMFYSKNAVGAALRALLGS